MSKVYLAGAISGHTYHEAQRWRNTVADSLAPQIECFSPLRCKDYLQAKGGPINGAYEGHALSTARGIMTRDHWDCMTCDLVFANLLGATSVSIGTVMEIAWAHAYRKPVVFVIERTGNIHDHPMVTEAAGFRVETIAQGLEVTRAILTSRVSTPRYQTPNTGDTR
jgi:nucleoside 2-deoxyribosyltransferase